MAGIGLFLVGSALSGLSGSMVQLVFFRALQGLGAGAILPVTLTIFGDLFDVEERARYQGLLGSVWGFSALVGPALGSAIITTIGWRWIFYVNLPVGIISAALLLRYLREQVPERRPRLDWPGALVLSAAVAGLLVALALGGTYRPWADPLILGLLALGVALSGLFVWVESRAPEPIVPLDLMRIRMIGASSLANVFFGVVLFATSAYIPLFVQGVLGRSVQTTALVVTSMSISWPIASALSARAILRWGYRPATVLGQGLQLAAVALWLGLGPFWLQLSPPVATGVALGITLLVGAGFGLSSSAYVIGVQNAVPWSRRGVATATLTFVRSLGQTAGGAVLGSILASRLRSGLAALPPSAGGALELGHSGAGLDPVAAGLAPELAAMVRAVLLDAVGLTLVVTVAAAALGLLFSLRIPPGAPERGGRAAPARAPAKAPAPGEQPSGEA